MLWALAGLALVAVIVALVVAARNRPAISAPAPAAKTAPPAPTPSPAVPPPGPPLQLTHRQAPLPHSLRVSKFRIQGPMDEGAAAFVYRIVDDQGKVYALKLPNWEALMDPAYIARFRREVSICQGLKHPNIIEMVDSGSYVSTDGIEVPYLVMEMLQGQTLDRWIEDCVARKVPPDTAFATRVGIQVAEALGAFHIKSIIHRDIRPGNCMLCEPERTIKVIDFGIARTAKVSSITVRGFPLGSPDYISPEQATDSSAVDPRTDLYSLGILLYQLSTWHVPFEDVDPLKKVARKKAEEPPTPLQFNPDLPAGLEEVILKLLRRDPAQRYANAFEAAQALKALS